MTNAATTCDTTAPISDDMRKELCALAARGAIETLAENWSNVMSCSECRYRRGQFRLQKTSWALKYSAVEAGTADDLECHVTQYSCKCGAVIRFIARYSSGLLIAGLGPISALTPMITSENIALEKE